jgi:hypothetical protein
MTLKLFEIKTIVLATGTMPEICKQIVTPTTNRASNIC